MKQQSKKLKGLYVIVFELDKDQHISIGSLGVLFFKRGLYVYVGSAMNGLVSRIKRHLSRRKRFHWHIDYFSIHGQPIELYIKEKATKKSGGKGKDMSKGERANEEASIANCLSSHFAYVPKFGSSDSSAPSHFFFISNGSGEGLKGQKEGKDMLRQILLSKGFKHICIRGKVLSDVLKDVDELFS